MANQSVNKDCAYFYGVDANKSGLAPLKSGAKSAITEPKFCKKNMEMLIIIIYNIFHK